MDVSLQAMAPKKLLSKRARQNATGEGFRVAPQADLEFDGHRFRSEEHQRCFEAIKSWTFLKERRVQLREGEYNEFQEEVARRQWTQLVGPKAKYNLEIVMEFYTNAWPTEEGVRDKHSWVRGQ